MPLSAEDKAWLAGRLDSVDSRLEAVEERLNKRLDAVEERLNKRLDSVDKRLDAVEKQLDSVGKRLDAVENRLDAVDKRLDQTGVRLDGLTRYLLDFRGEVVQRLTQIDSRYELVTSAMVAIETRFAPLTKGVLEFGTHAGQLAQEQWKQRDATVELATRLTRLEEQVARLMKPAA